MNSQNMRVLINVIGAVESGGQVYGQRNYSAYAAPYTSTPNEHTITLGWAQNYGDEARKLVQMIFDADPAAFRQMDNAGIEGMLSKDWVAIRWNPTSTQRSDLIAIISSETGRRAQDELFAELMEKFISDCESTYTIDVKAQMMYCEIRHLGGKGPADRIFKRCSGNYSLDSIMNSLKQDQYDTSSSNQVGDAIFWSRHEKCKEFINKYAVEESTSMVLVSNCGHDERGGISGGTAGDQTGTEWEIREWYQYSPGGWQYVLRHPDPNVRKLLALYGIEAAQNDYVGYDQGQRITYWDALQAAGYRPKDINVPCEADCSSGAAGNVKAVGYTLGVTSLQQVSADCYTGNIRGALQSAGFEVLSDPKYLNSPDYLLEGDLLLREGWHICTVVSDGSSSGEEESDDEVVIEGIRNVSIGSTSIYAAKVNTDELKLRLYPSEDAPTQRWDHLNFDNPVYVMGTDKSGKWALVVFCYGSDGSYGWMWKDYLTKIEVPKSTTPTMENPFKNLTQDQLSTLAEIAKLIFK